MFPRFATRVSGSVVAGTARSWALMSSPPVRLWTCASEHTGTACSSSSQFADHSRKVCDSNEIDGTRNSSVAAPPFSAASRSAILSEVNVLPVPQAMISLPRSRVASPASTLSTAVRWWGRRSLRVVRCSSSSTSSDGQARSQVIGAWAISARPTRATGMCWLSSAASALAPHLSVVEMMIRLVNGRLPDAVKNESMSAFCRWWSGA